MRCALKNCLVLWRFTDIGFVGGRHYISRRRGFSNFSSWQGGGMLKHFFGRKNLYLFTLKEKPFFYIYAMRSMKRDLKSVHTDLRIGPNFERDNKNSFEI